MKKYTLNEPIKGIKFIRENHAEIRSILEKSGYDVDEYIWCSSLTDADKDKLYRWYISLRHYPDEKGPLILNTGDLLVISETGYQGYQDDMNVIDVRFFKNHLKECIDEEIQS